MTDNRTGDYQLSPFDIDGWFDFPYGMTIDCMNRSMDHDLSRCIGVVRSALKKAKASL